MTNGRTSPEKLRELGYTDDDFTTENLLRQAKEVMEKFKIPVPQRKVYAYPCQEIRKGRPYYYLQWFVRDAMGKRKHHKKYLGTSLPKGYTIGKPVEMKV